MKKLIVLLLVISLGACTGEQTGDDIVVKIDLRTPADKKTTDSFLSRLSSIRLVPLETNDECITAAHKYIVSDNHILAVDQSQKIIFLFSEDGKYQHKIDKQGQGPEEYNYLSDVKVLDGTIHVLDVKHIQQYTMDGEHIRTIPVEGGFDMYVMPEGGYAVSGRNMDDYLLKIYDSEGNKQVQYMPRTEKYGDLMFQRPSGGTIGHYDNGIHFCRYYDPTIYYLKDNEVKKLYEFDFGPDGIPEEAFAGDGEQNGLKLEDLKFKVVVAIVDLIMIEDMAIFCPETWRESFYVYFNMKDRSYITNAGLPFPYSTLLGGYKKPQGYHNGEFYYFINSADVKEMLEELKATGKLAEYDFLKDLDPKQIDETDNPWILFAQFTN